MLITCPKKFDRINLKTWIKFKTASEILILDYSFYAIVLILSQNRFLIFLKLFFFLSHVYKTHTYKQRPHPPLTIAGSAEGHAAVLQLDDGFGGLAGHVMNGILIA